MSDEADDIATNILHHIDSMYPKMWDGVSRDSARTSIRNTISREVAATIERDDFKKTSEVQHSSARGYYELADKLQDQNNELQPKADAFDVLKEILANGKGVNPDTYADRVGAALTAIQKAEGK